jgi:hypothetical protein
MDDLKRVKECSNSNDTTYDWGYLYMITTEYLKRSIKRLSDEEGIEDWIKLLLGDEPLPGVRSRVSQAVRDHSALSLSWADGMLEDMLLRVPLPIGSTLFSEDFFP